MSVEEARRDVFRAFERCLLDGEDDGGDLCGAALDQLILEVVEEVLPPTYIVAETFASHPEWALEYVEKVARMRGGTRQEAAGR